MIASLEDVAKRVMVFLTSYLRLYSCTRFLKYAFMEENVRAQDSVLLL